jgi:hypothetical protein
MKNERRYNVKLTGKDIHDSFCKVAPDEATNWDELPALVRTRYDDVAEDLNRQMEVETEDTVTISAARCPDCNEMLDVQHAERHACWQKGA